MIPSQFLSKYHSMAVVDPLQGINCTVNIKNYVSGSNNTLRGEYNKCIGRIAAKFLKLKFVSQVPTWFKIPSDQIPPQEYFSKPSLKRAYNGRASPSELRDAIRLAVLAGRCTSSGAGVYAKKWFGQDCNAFVGNYQGISPSTSINAYVAGYGKKATISGASKDVYMSREALPLPPVTSPTQITSGTVLITYRPEYSKWAHIALVDSFNVLDEGKVNVNIVEWGQAGGTGAHTSNKTVTLKHQDFSETIGRFKGKKLYGFWDKNGADLRVFFDAAKWLLYASRGWQIAGAYES